MKHQRIRSPLDELYADLPDTRPRFRWPVCDDPFTMKPVQWFDSYGAAVECVNSKLGSRNLYIGEPQRWESVEL